LQINVILNGTCLEGRKLGSNGKGSFRITALIYVMQKNQKSSLKKPSFSYPILSFPQSLGGKDIYERISEQQKREHRLQGLCG